MPYNHAQNPSPHNENTKKQQINDNTAVSIFNPSIQKSTCSHPHYRLKYSAYCIYSMNPYAKSTSEKLIDVLFLHAQTTPQNRKRT